MKKFSKIITLVIFTLIFASCSSTESQTSEASQEASEAVESGKDKMEKHAQSPTAAGKRTCTKGKDVRHIEVVSTDSGCAVNYTKFGNTSEIATATKDMGHCDRVSEKVQVNLVESGFSCN